MSQTDLIKIIFFAPHGFQDAIDNDASRYATMLLCLASRRYPVKHEPRQIDSLAHQFLATAYMWCGCHCDQKRL